jgi:Tfp pilus assembly protein PilF
VRTARWLRENLPPDAVVATHDIGAIAFYSGKRIVDMVGLVSPEMIENIGSFDKLKRFLVAKKATHLAVLRNWFEVGNQNPIFQTDERQPEIMEVFQFDPARTHFTPQNVGQMTSLAANYLSTGRLQQAGSLLEQALRIDPQSSKAHFYLGSVLLALGNLANAKTEIETALQLHPSYLDAQVALAELSARQNRPDEAISHLEKIIQLNPTYAHGYGALAQVYRTFHLDSVRASQYLQRYRELSGGVAQ